MKPLWKRVLTKPIHRSGLVSSVYSNSRAKKRAESPVTARPIAAASTPYVVPASDKLRTSARPAPVDNGQGAGVKVGRHA